MPEGRRLRRALAIALLALVAVTGLLMMAKEQQMGQEISPFDGRSNQALAQAVARLFVHRPVFFVLQGNEHHARIHFPAGETSDGRVVAPHFRPRHHHGFSLFHLSVREFQGGSDRRLQTDEEHALILRRHKLAS